MVGDVISADQLPELSWVLALFWQRDYEGISTIVKAGVELRSIRLLALSGCSTM
jgi:hypothetical protein